MLGGRGVCVRAACRSLSDPSRARSSGLWAGHILRTILEQLLHLCTGAFAAGNALLTGLAPLSRLNPSAPSSGVGGGNLSHGLGRLTDRPSRGRRPPMVTAARCLLRAAAARRRAIGNTHLSESCSCGLLGPNHNRAVSACIPSSCRGQLGRPRGHCGAAGDQGLGPADMGRLGIRF